MEEILPIDGRGDEMQDVLVIVHSDLVGSFGKLA